ncbi:MAG: hypothetical protein EVA89_00485 [Sandaracinaceae bacterium]|nr:MAG: hypothetical protein EVA89_00485 [Sandaracinaceae bacterium]
MASFSDEFPFAFHVFPLTAARGILSTRALLSKAALGGRGEARRTTRDVDRVLGFADFVHFYLPSGSARFEDLPILGAQLAPAKRPPVPHAVVVIDTARFDDAECTVCNWNIAVSRPGVPGECKGGNWTRGTRPERIAEVWDAFRASRPSVKRARGFWGEPRVPILSGEKLAEHWRLMRGKRRSRELLLRGRVDLGAAATIHAFSDADRRSLMHVEGIGGVRIERSEFDGYTQAPDPLDPDVRAALDAHLAGDGPMPALDFDARRS